MPKAIAPCARSVERFGAAPAYGQLTERTQSVWSGARRAVPARLRRNLVERGHPRASDSPAPRASDSRQLRAWASDPGERLAWASEQTSQMHATPLHLVVVVRKARDAGMSVRRLARRRDSNPRPGDPKSDARGSPVRALFRAQPGCPNDPDWAELRVSMVLTFRMSLVPTPARRRIRCPPSSPVSEAHRRSSAGTVYRDLDMTPGR